MSNLGMEPKQLSKQSTSLVGEHEKALIHYYEDKACESENLAHECEADERRYEAHVRKFKASTRKSKANAGKSEADARYWLREYGDKAREYKADARKYEAKVSEIRETREKILTLQKGKPESSELRELESAALEDIQLAMDQGIIPRTVTVTNTEETDVKSIEP